MSSTWMEDNRGRYDSNLIIKPRLVAIRADICHPMKGISYRSNRYFVAMTAGERKYVRVHFLKSRSGINDYLENYVKWIERHSGRRVGGIHTDNVPEFSQIKN